MKTSIALTTYNGKKYLKPLLDSIRKQAQKPDEVIIVDDCSSDGTFEYINEYIRQYNLKTWKNMKNTINLGWCVNFRKAISFCTGDIIFLCDQDDIWLPTKILEMKRIMSKNNNVQLLVSNYYIKGKDKVYLKDINRNDGSIKKMRFKSSSLSVLRPGCTYCFRKELFLNLKRHDMSFKPHDAMLWGYASIKDAIYLYNKKTIVFRRHSGSASNPSKPLSIERRVKEIKSDIELEQFFLSECRIQNLSKNAQIIKKQLKFSTDRVNVLRSQSIIRMILFQIQNVAKYPTVRNMLSDIYVMM